MLNENLIDESPDVELIKVVDRFHVGEQLRKFMHTTYHIGDNDVYVVEQKTYILVHKQDDAYQVKFNKPVAEFVDGDSDFMDVLNFLSL